MSGSDGIGCESAYDATEAADVSCRTDGACAADATAATARSASARPNPFRDRNRVTHLSYQKMQRPFLLPMSHRGCFSSARCCGYRTLRIISKRPAVITAKDQTQSMLIH